jgi:hypothetical protein
MLVCCNPGMDVKMTFHLDDRQAHLLRAIARVENVPVVALVRTGIDLAIDQHLGDPAFRALLHNALEADRRLFEEELPDESGE